MRTRHPYSSRSPLPKARLSPVLFPGVSSASLEGLEGGNIGCPGDQSQMRLEEGFMICLLITRDADMAPNPSNGFVPVPHILDESLDPDFHAVSCGCLPA